MSIGSTPSRSASQASSSSEGTTSPRSIWLTYCFVKPPVRELDLRHPGGASWRANTTGDPGRWRDVRCILHRDPTVRSFPKELPDVLDAVWTRNRRGRVSGPMAPGVDERRGWDSNPRTSCPVSGFQDRPIRPLSHPAGP